jgi:hypothetical protein
VQILGPIAADHSFGRALWGFAGAVQILGLVVGSTFATGLRGRLRLAPAAFGALAVVLPLVVLALLFAIEPGVVDPVHWFFWLGVALFAAGAGLQVFAVPLDAAIQLQVPRAYLTRTYACLTLATLAGMPVGEVAVGPLVRILGAPAALLGLAAVAAVAVIGVWLTPRVRRVDRTM